jgi:hypothetical protein
MFMKLNVWVLGIALPVITSASAYPQVAPWSTFPGSTTVGGSFDRETIRGGTGAGTFRAVQLRVVGGPVKVDRLVVRYGDAREELACIPSSRPAAALAPSLSPAIGAPFEALICGMAESTRGHVQP